MGVQVVGFVCVVIGIGLSIRAANNGAKMAENNARATENAAVTAVSGYSLKLDELFIDHPEMKPYFCDGKPVKKGDPDFERALLFAEMHLDVMDSMLSTHGFPPHDGWTVWIRESFQRSPVLTEYLLDNHRYYPTLKKKFDEWEAERNARN